MSFNLILSADRLSRGSRKLKSNFLSQRPDVMTTARRNDDEREVQRRTGSEAPLNFQSLKFGEPSS